MTSLLQAVQGALGRPRTEPSGPGERITWETVDQRRADGSHVVLGRPLPVTGLQTFPAGARVAVAWKDGQPAAILGHRWRRAQFHGAFREVAVGIVEELFIADLDERGADVWYRNHERVSKIGVLAFLAGHAPQAVKWGYDGASFAVQCADGYYAVFSLDRDDPNVVTPDAPGEASLLALSRPLDSTVPLVTATYQSRAHVKNVEFYGKTTSITSYVWVENVFHPRGGSWYPVIGSLTAGWEAESVSEATASGGTSKSFPLKDVLAGSLADWYGNHTVHGAVLEWFLGADRHLYFAIRVDWDYFWVGTNQQGSASYTYRWGPQPGDVDQATIHTGIGGVGAIGAKKAPALGGETVPESHLFLFDGTAQAVTWATAENAAFGRTSEQVVGRLWEHVILQDPGSPDGFYPAVNAESYYRGANWTNTPQETLVKEAGVIGDSAPLAHSSTGTFQLFSPGRCPFLGPPFSTTDQQSTFQQHYEIVGTYGHFWRVNFTTQARTVQQLWHYRVATAQPFQANAQAQVFLVVERYPFLAGTGYINDVPQLGIFIVGIDGALIRTLRTFQFGLASAALLSANAHRMLWTLTEVGQGNRQSFRYSDFDAGIEVVLTPAQVESWLARTARLYSPDFLYDPREPQEFLTPGALPGLETDDVLQPYADLAAAVAAGGDARMVNDEGILAPLDRYRDT